MKYFERKLSLFLGLACFLLAFFCFSAPASAQISQAFSFQGKITETDGSELADGAYDFRFRLYDVPSGGAAIWSEDLLASTSFTADLSNAATLGNITTYDYAADTNETSLRIGQYLSDGADNAYLIADFDTAANTVSVVSTTSWADGTAVNNRPYVEGGIIDIALGSVTSLSGIDIDQPLYLEVIFEGETMSPRKSITPVLQALNSDTLDGFHASDFANLTDNATVSGEWTFDNIVNIATTSNLTALSITQNGTGDLVDFRIGATSSFAILNDGRVQIGDYRFPTTYGAPGYVLKTDLNGDLYWAVDWAGSGGGIGLWATSTDSLLIVQSDVGQKVVFGNTGTTSPIAAQFEVQGLSWFDTVAVSNAQSLRFYDTDSSNFIALRATGTLASNYTLTLPNGYGSNGQSLVTDGLGNLSWATPASSLVTVAYGGTGTTTFEANSLVYASAKNTIGEILSTTPGRVLQLNASGVPTWVSTSSLGISFATMSGMAEPAQGGTGQDSTGWTGFAYVNGGVWSASNTIAATRLDNVVMLQGENISLLNNDANYINLSQARAGITSSSTSITYDQLTGGIDLAAGRTIPLAASTTNWTSAYDSLTLNAANWSTAYNSRITGTSSNLQFAGNTLSVMPGYAIPSLASSTNWNQAYNWGNHTQGGYFATSSGHILSVAYGGTGTSTFEANSLLYASARNVIGEIPASVPGRILQLNGSGVPTWVSTTSLGINFSAIDGTIVPDQGGTGQDSTTWTGFAYVNGGVWSASNTIAATRLDAVVMLQGEDVSLLNNDAGFITDGNTGWDNSYGFITLSGLSATAPLSYNNTNGTFSLSKASSTADGYLSSTDWTTFNSKQNALTLGNVTENVSNVLTITGGTGAVVGAGLTIEVDTDLANYSNVNTNFISLASLSGVAPLSYDSGTGQFSLGVVPVANGGTGSSTAAGARENLDLDEIYDFSINSAATSGWIWMSDGVGRGQWTPSTTLMALASGASDSKFVGTTTALFDGYFQSGGKQGYQAANDACASEFTGSHFCRVYDILVTVEQNDISDWGASAWVAEGPPGYTSNSNDCQGWTSDNGSHMGAFWAFDSDGGGMGWLTNCAVTKPIACCAR